MAKAKPIYHYCSLDTFMAIVQSKCLRLSDLNKTNDYMEKKWVNKLISKVLKKELDKCDIKINLEEDYYYNEQSANHLQYYQNELSYELNNESPILITCFSKERDKLSQWRAYGQDGLGIAIGFNKRKIKLLNNDKNIIVDNVIYNENKQKEKLGEYINLSIQYIKNMYENESFKTTNDFNVYFEEEFDAFCEVLLDYIGKVGCIIKNPAFSEEKEMRIIYNPHLPDIDDFGDIN